MEDWQQRVLDEKRELGDKIVRLDTFIGSPGYNVLHEPEQARLRRQHYHMKHYYQVLQERVDAWKPQRAPPTNASPTARGE
jgi:hypothetical protein